VLLGGGSRIQTTLSSASTVHAVNRALSHTIPTLQSASCRHDCPLTEGSQVFCRFVLLLFPSFSLMSTEYNNYCRLTPRPGTVTEKARTPCFQSVDNKREPTAGLSGSRFIFIRDHLSILSRINVHLQSQGWKRRASRRASENTATKVLILIANYRPGPCRSPTERAGCGPPPDPSDRLNARSCRSS
jgi:hypothetical protein